MCSNRVLEMYYFSSYNKFLSRYRLPKWIPEYHSHTVWISLIYLNFLTWAEFLTIYKQKRSNILTKSRIEACFTFMRVFGIWTEIDLYFIQSLRMALDSMNLICYFIFDNFWQSCIANMYFQIWCKSDKSCSYIKILVDYIRKRKRLSSCFLYYRPITVVIINYIYFHEAYKVFGRLL